MDAATFDFVLYVGFVFMSTILTMLIIDWNERRLNYKANWTSRLWALKLNR